jgi:hypothetical protein
LLGLIGGGTGSQILIVQNAMKTKRGRTYTEAAYGLLLQPRYEQQASLHIGATLSTMQNRKL